MTNAPRAPTAGMPPASPPMDPKDIRAIIIGLMIVMLLAALDQTIVSTALPTIGRKLGDIEHLPWVVTIYLLSSTVVTPLYGKLADIIGRRTTLLIAIVIFLVGSALCGAATNMLLLILARGIQGLGGGGLMSLVQTVISDVVTVKERARLQGYFAAVFTSSSLGGPVLGGFIAEKVHWSAIFLINLPVGALALWIVYKALLKLPRHERPHKIDWLGAALMAVAATTLMLALNSGRTGSTGPVPVWGVVAISVVFWLLFGLRLRFAAEPLIPTDILKNGIVMRAIVTSTLGMGVMIGVSIYNPIYLQQVYHLSASMAGVSMAPLSIGVVGGSILSGRLMSKGKGRGYKRAPMAGLLIAGLIYAALAVFPDRLNLWGYIAALFVANLGIGTMMPISIVVVQTVVERHQMGTATGVMNFFRSLGGALLVAVFGGVLFAEISHIAGATVSGGVTPAILDKLSHINNGALIYRPIFAMGSAGLLLSFVTLWSMEEKPLRNRDELTVARDAKEAAPGLDLEGADFSD